MPQDNIIDKAKKKAVDALTARSTEMGKAVYDILVQAIEDTFDIKQGSIVATGSFVRQLNKLTQEVLDAIGDSKDFAGPVSQFAKRLDNISSAIDTFHRNTSDIKVPALDTVKKIAVDEILNQMLDNGLNQNFVQPLRDLIYQNVTAGLSLKEAKAELRELATGRLRSYMEQTAQQGVDSYSGLINKKILEQFPNMDALQMTGTLIDNSSPQCKYAIEELGGVITRKNWPKVRAIAVKNGLIDRTTFENLPLQRLHWGCRHSFYPIISQ